MGGGALILEKVVYGLVIAISKVIIVLEVVAEFILLWIVTRLWAIA
jgi:hypothetical protein